MTLAYGVTVELVEGLASFDQNGANNPNFSFTIARMLDMIHCCMSL